MRLPAFALDAALGAQPDRRHAGAADGGPGRPFHRQRGARRAAVPGSPGALSPPGPVVLLFLSARLTQG